MTLDFADLPNPDFEESTRKEVFCEEHRQWDENADHQSKDKREGCGPDHGPLETCSVRFCTRLVNGKYVPPVGLAWYLNGSSGQLFNGALVDITFSGGAICAWLIQGVRLRDGDSTSRGPVKVVRI